MANPARRAQLLDLIRLVEQEETLLGAATHMNGGSTSVTIFLRAPLVLFRLIPAYSIDAVPCITCNSLSANDLHQPRRILSYSGWMSRHYGWPETAAGAGRVAGATCPGPHHRSW